MFLASIFSHTSDGEKRVFVAVGHTKAAAESAMPEVLENFGYTQAQIGRMLGRMSTHPMGRKTHGSTQVITLPY